MILRRRAGISFQNLQTCQLNSISNQKIVKFICRKQSEEQLNLEDRYQSVANTEDFNEGVKAF